MQEVFEKIKERLEEKKSKYQNLADSSNFDGWHEEDIKYTAKADMCEEIIEIVNQVAAEYRNAKSEYVEIADLVEKLRSEAERQENLTKLLRLRRYSDSEIEELEKEFKDLIKSFMLLSLSAS